MNWYEGGIEEAVKSSKQKGAIFVVYVEGKDQKSNEFSQLIDEAQVLELLQSDYFVAIKVLDGSVSLEQFRQIYKQVAVPSLFFIGKNGTPLEIITEPLNINELLEKLNQILLKHGIVISTKEPLIEKPKIVIDNKQEPLKEKYEVVCDNDVCSLKRIEDPSTSNEVENTEKGSVEDVEKEQTTLTPEEKLDRAKDLVNKTREAKRLQEEENERRKEIERRKTGQDVQKLKRWQHDNDLKELVEERNKEKKEQEAARKRILQQIAQDKAERAAKYAPSSSQPTTSTNPTTTSNIRASADSDSARIQFRLPDGSSCTHEFSSNSTLQEVHNYILTNMKLPFQNYALSTTFPRREFTTDEALKTLLELGLTPTAVILIVPLHGLVDAHHSSWFITYFWSFIGPLLNFVSYLKDRIMGRPPRGTTSPPSVRERKRITDNPPESSSVPNKKRMGETSVIRRQGNIHRLADKSDSEDENNTWNGNSTQQM